MAKLSTPQIKMLQRLASGGDELTPGGRSDSGRAASAWHRTLDVLVRRGLAERTSNGASYRASITDAGRVIIGLPSRATASMTALKRARDLQPADLIWTPGGDEVEIVKVTRSAKTVIAELANGTVRHYRPMDEIVIRIVSKKDRR